MPIMVFADQGIDWTSFIIWELFMSLAASFDPIFANTENVVVEEYVFKKNNEDTLKLKDGANIIKCHNCGASIDATKGSCEHCGTKIKYLQE